MPQLSHDAPLVCRLVLTSFTLTAAKSIPHQVIALLKWLVATCRLIHAGTTLPICSVSIPVFLPVFDTDVIVVQLLHIAHCSVGDGACWIWDWWVVGVG
jgi:hypothetical protein